MDRKLVILIIAFSILGLIDSAYLTYTHYSSDGSKLCDQIGNFQCDIVTKSLYSELTGIFSLFGIDLYLPVPVSLLGFFYFAGFLFFSVSMLKPLFGLNFRKKELVRILFFLSILGISFGFFLIYIQAFVLRSWCLFCLILDLILLSLLLLVMMLKRSRHV